MLQAQAAIKEKHKAAEALGSTPVDCETDLRKELQLHFDVDVANMWQPWKQCREDCELLRL